MPDYQASMVDARDDLSRRMAALVRDAGAEKRDLTSDEDAELKRLDGQRDRLTGEIRKLETLSARTSGNDALRARVHAATRGQEKAMSADFQELGALMR